MPDRVIRTERGGLCTLTLNRPEKLNALDTATFEQLDEHLAVLQQSQTVGCVVVRGAGKAFSAGADLKGLSGVQAPPRYKPGIIERLGTLKQPVIAAVHGVCFTGALELALACDFILADASARFADTHGKWGLVSAWGMSQRLPRRIGMPAAKRMMMTGVEVSAHEAKSLRLIDELVPEGGLDQAVQALADQILANSWHSNFATKRMMIETDGMSLPQGLAHEHFRYPGWAPDHEERIAAFGKK